MIHVNHGTASQAHVPFGGVKESGPGGLFDRADRPRVLHECQSHLRQVVSRRRKPKDLALEPLALSLQLGARAYRALWSGIVGGGIESGVQLRPDTIAEQLDISTTPVREALHRLETDGLIVKLPYKGWFVREFTEQEVRDLYEMRAALECFGVRLACETHHRRSSSTGCANISRSAKRRCATATWMPTASTTAICTPRSSRRRATPTCRR